ncbi:MAG: carbamoyltransferase [Planctomycetota bacterium]
MHVLGLSFNYHDSAACLVSNGKIVAACEEERFSRRKHDSAYPRGAIEFCLKEGGIGVPDLDHIVFYEKPLVKFDRILRVTLSEWPRALPLFADSTRQWMRGKIFVLGEIKKQTGFRKPVLTVPHHSAHAASAYYPSGFESAAILTMDGVGEWTTTAIGHGKGPRFETLREIRFPHSIGLFYSALTAYLGFKVNDAEWKVMGLAPYGKPTLLEKFRKLVQQRPDGSFRFDLSYFSHPWSRRSMITRRWEELFGAPPRARETELTDFHRDLAASGQALAEELILGVAREARRLTGEKRLCIGGGVGLNCVANWKIQSEGIFDEVFIQPGAGDDGGALGAACLVSHGILGEPRPGPMDHAFFGPSWSDDEIRAFARSRSLPHQSFNNESLVKWTAEQIAKGEVVGFFQGRQEFGPRSLGHRSLLAHPGMPGMKDKINAKVKYREAFRPFAPAVQAEKAHLYFDMPEGLKIPYMLMTPQVRPAWRERLSAITHADGSARVQTVDKKVDPLFHALLGAVEQQTGAAVLLNTSFNVRGEPLVTSPGDAWDCYVRSGIDVLVMGTLAFTQKPATVDHEAALRHSVSLEA